MIIVNLKPNPFHQNAFLSENLYMNAGIITWRVNMRPHLWRPSTDVFEIEDRYITRVEIAGMNEADFQINIDQNILTISGSRPDTGEHRAFHQMEIHFGEFISQVEFPNNIDRDNVNAEYKDGFLTVILPKAPPTQIKISKE